ncbi:MAG TPA: hypothetical protein VGL97_19025 [Bryobacteraceae bacterium]|jgi:hypothetical protein
MIGPPKYTEPHEGHGGTKYEGVDARASMVIWSLSIIGGTLVIVFALTIGLQKMLEHDNPVGELPSPLAPSRILAPAPQVQVHPWEELPDMRAHENDVLNSSGKDAEGHIHIPINQAMNAVISRLKIRPDAPPGITTPGGEGRDFSRALSYMPPAYQVPQPVVPQIRGEIHKHAQ